VHNKDYYRFLFNINSPADLRRLPQETLPHVCDEVREFIVDTITQTGGHFGAGLGVVELTVALHFAFNTPKDKIIWDVGHQGYPHKILTGRRDQLHTIRQKGGLSGFLKIDESEYDVFGAGHASTSISAALGVAAARDFQNQDHKVVAVIGDGSMTGGLAFEAMNNCGVQKRDIIVILNDNNISIDPNVSAISNYFNELFASQAVNKIRGNIWDLAGRFEGIGDRLRKAASRVEGSIKSVMTPGMLFEAFGFNYFGPLNGHNIAKLVKMLRLTKELKGPILLHVMTEKGKGYAPAENDYHKLHAIGKIDKTTGKSLAKTKELSVAPMYYKVFGDAMVELCKKDEKIIGVTAAMLDGTGLDILDKEMPERVFDVGIAEGHAVTFASGMAVQGMKPVVAIYSTFLQRAYDHIIHDCALQNQHVVFVLDRAGIVGEDGPTHHGVMDIAYLRTIPNMKVAAPKDENEFRNLLYSSLIYYTNGPTAIRIPRGKALGVDVKEFEPIKLGSWERLTYGNDIAILAVGKMVDKAMSAAGILKAEGIEAEVINARFIKPLDSEFLIEILSNHCKIMTVEDGQKMGGFGSAVLEFMAENSLMNKEIYIHGIPDKFIQHGTQDELLSDLQLNARGIADKVRSFIQKELEVVFIS
jgi:1-deoxy-D-xylulose-5-phosphate synthase